MAKATDTLKQKYESWDAIHDLVLFEELYCSSKDFDNNLTAISFVVEYVPQQYSSGFLEVVRQIHEQLINGKGVYADILVIPLLISTPTFNRSGTETNDREMQKVSWFIPCVILTRVAYTQFFHGSKDARIWWC